MVKNSIQIQSVLYKNEKTALLKALNSLSNAVRVNKSSDFKVGDVIVNYGDASPERVFSDEEIANLNNEFQGLISIKYTYFAENTGTAKGHNRLAKDCNCEYMLIMNPDVVVCPKFFEKMIAPFFDEAINTGLTEARQTPIEHPKEYDRNTLETPWAATACALFKTEVFNEINGFDEDTFFMYCDDLDFSWRIRLTGRKIIYLPDCVVFHAKTLSAGGTWAPTNAEIYYSAEAAILMAYKWSENARYKKLLKGFSSSGDENLVKAANHFYELKRNGKLPKQIDPKHKVARFIGDNYANHRFSL